MDQFPDISPFAGAWRNWAPRWRRLPFSATSRRAADVTREHQKLQRLVEDYSALERLAREEDEAAALAKDPAGDPEMRELAAAELPALVRRREACISRCCRR